MRRLFAFFLHLGPFGPLLLGIGDSSFLFLPFGNDLLLVILIARNPSLFPLYVGMAALGSMIGVLLLDAVCRKGGKEGLKKMLKPKRIAYMKKRMEEHAGFMIALACIAPPPFPFTAVIAAASALAYPRKRLLAIAFAGRLIRFTLVGLAAIHWGRGILRIARSPEVTWGMIAFTVVCIVGSTISVVGWVRRSKYQPATA
jgi:membrane protein YqaA with SNARE-associated domain